jgi:hypothetical protein
MLNFYTISRIHALTSIGIGAVKIVFPETVALVIGAPEKIAVLGIGHFMIFFGSFVFFTSLDLATKRWQGHAILFIDVLRILIIVLMLVLRSGSITSPGHFIIALIGMWISCISVLYYIALRNLNRT